MNKKDHPFSTKLSISIRVICIILLLSVTSCSLNPFILPSPTPIPTQTQPVQDTDIEPIPLVETIFAVDVPERTDPNAAVSLNILDEVTGLAFNQTRYPLQPLGEHRYATRVILPLGSIVKYHYTQDEDPAVVEHTPLGKPVRYRLAHITGPGLQIRDYVSAWSDQPYSGPTGRISGVVTDQIKLTGIPNLMVSAAGVSTYTASDGSYLLENLSPGTHNLVVYALDGSYPSFQQGAIVSGDATTPAPVRLTENRLVNITFLLQIPDERIVNLPVRMAGNLYQTGNTFADLTGSSTAIASRMPLLTLMPDGRYSLTLQLPAGADFRYKYTLGDGFWNSEQTADAHFRVRQFIVPDQDTVVQDTVISWRSASKSPVMFEVQVPDYTPAEDYISIQLNPFTWMEPVPMWSLGGNRWLYVLFSPLNDFDKLEYRYCRNDQCAYADDATTPGPSPVGPAVTLSTERQEIKSSVTAWYWLQPPGDNQQVIETEIFPRDTFISGVELQADYHPSWQSRYPVVFQDIFNTSVGWVFLTPTWSYPYGTQPLLEPAPGVDPTWFDLNQIINQANSWQFNIALFPTPQFDRPYHTWWEAAPRDQTWWEAWFSRYEAFLLHHADLAASNNVEALILGGEWLAPAFPGGALPDGSPSGVPEDADTRWRNLIQSVRSRYSGNILWASDYPEGIQAPPAFLEAVDGVYLLFSAPLTDQPDASQAEIQGVISQIFDTEIAPFQITIGKPLIIGIAYPSINGAVQGCHFSPQVGCLDWEQLHHPDFYTDSFELDLQEQADIYNAFLGVVNQREWVSGFISRGYYPPAALHDLSASVHGKPAADILRYWFSNFSPNQ